MRGGSEMGGPSGVSGGSMGSRIAKAPPTNGGGGSSGGGSLARTSRPSVGSRITKTSPASRNPAPSRTAAPARGLSSNNNSGGGGGGGGNNANALSANSQAQIEELTAQLLESKLTIEGLEKERDFYFGKLRDIEVLAQEHEEDGGEFSQKTLGVLYATEDGFAVPDDEEIAPTPAEEF
eukprot:TRINITY_DN717_c0_g2_i4.p1 TRINITY_DN717_c0_g2~~TRINITY_DN717_c0_g2_i4.p1  ORF type:complete len:179 (+),score=65.13 TRINITY_DN717_c0_g2_i4:401-937(+)